MFYKAGFVESWGRGYKKIAEELERAMMPLPTIEEAGGGVVAIVQRKTVDDVIAERGENVGDKCRRCVGDQTFCSSTYYYLYHPVKPFCFRQTNVGDFVGDIKDYRKGFIGHAESRHHTP